MDSLVIICFMNLFGFLYLFLAFAESAFIGRNSLRRIVTPMNRLNFKPSSSPSYKRPYTTDANKTKSSFLAMTASFGIGLGGYVYYTRPACLDDSIEYDFFKSYHVPYIMPILNNYLLAECFVLSGGINSQSFEAFLRVLDDDSDHPERVNIGSIEKVVIALFTEIKCNQELVKNILGRIEFKNEKIKFLLEFFRKSARFSLYTCEADHISAMIDN